MGTPPSFAGAIGDGRDGHEHSFPRGVSEVSRWRGSAGTDTAAVACAGAGAVAVGEAGAARGGAVPGAKLYRVYMPPSVRCTAEDGDEGHSMRWGHGMWWAVGGLLLAADPLTRLEDDGRMDGQDGNNNFRGVVRVPTTDVIIARPGVGL